jgi:hypothetical protein
MPRIAVIAFLTASLLASVTSAEAQSRRCRVTDPTGTPLNIRVVPGGEIVGQLPNGVIVNSAEQARDGNGRTWVFLHNQRTGHPIGWVYREFISCF